MKVMIFSHFVWGLITTLSLLILNSSENLATVLYEYSTYKASYKMRIVYCLHAWGFVIECRNPYTRWSQSQPSRLGFANKPTRPNSIRKIWRLRPSDTSAPQESERVSKQWTINFYVKLILSNRIKPRNLASN